MAKFRTRARAVEMLGRQQIAGIPTAISELFKNAHDAYADRVEVDFFRSDQLFVLRDDGIGMSLEDFEQRWLTLGTESKLGMGGLELPELAMNKPLRPILGEKGIGRLAIAAIGPQVLALSRPAKPRPDDLVVAFIHWGLFRLPGINLDEIELPVRKLPGGSLPTAEIIAKMVAELQATLHSVASPANDALVQEIETDLRAFAVDPAGFEGAFPGPSLRADGHGTHFYIMPTDESLAATIEPPRDDDAAAPPLIKTLIGFSNTMTPGHTPPAIHTAFRDHKAPDLVDDIIETEEFFTPDEFRRADHHIEGTFDEYGAFRGTVTVYAKPTEGHVVPWPAAGTPTACGPFRLNLAVVQGERSATLLPPEEHALMVRKLNRIGGLYIYKDGVRVLPYGNNDYDYLDIERNRTKSASYYYFSYRRIFGVIEIDRTHNSELTEKAGREGFRENLAYRQFREILKNFFVQIAADFFREGGVRSSIFVEERTEIERVEKARRARERRVGERRATFERELEKAFSSMNEALPRKAIDEALETFSGDLTSAAALKRADDSTRAFLQAENKVRACLNDIIQDYRVSPPRGVGLPKRLRRDLEAYRMEYARLQADVFDGALREVERRFAQATSRAKVQIDRRVRFQRAIGELSERVQKEAQADAQEVRSALADVTTTITAFARESLGEIDGAVKDVLNRASRLELDRLSDIAFVNERTSLEEEVERVSQSRREMLTGLLRQLRSIRFSANGNEAVTEEDIAEATEEELLALRERSEADLELAQLGMAIQVINHEFDATIRNVRRNLRQLRAWADANSKLRSLYDSIAGNFAHLDGYLTLFTPLQRRLYRQAVKITGRDIAKFLQDLFKDRLSRERVTLEATTNFRKSVLTGYPSTFYPVFVNLVDNAIYWAGQEAEPRRIVLDAEGAVLLVSDSGPGVAPRDRDAVFELGFTRKPGGRGLGLHISRQVLAREGYQLTLTPKGGRGAIFRIEPKEDQGKPSNGGVG